MSTAAPLLVEMRHQPTSEDLRVFHLITKRSKILGTARAKAANLAVILQGVCAICYFAR